MKVEGGQYMLESYCSINYLCDLLQQLVLYIDGSGGMEEGNCSNRGESSPLDDKTKSLVRLEPDGLILLLLIIIRSEGGGSFQAADIPNGSICVNAATSIHVCLDQPLEHGEDKGKYYCLRVEGVCKQDCAGLIFYLAQLSKNLIKGGIGGGAEDKHMKNSQVTGTQSATQMSELAWFYKGGHTPSVL